MTNEDTGSSVSHYDAVIIGAGFAGLCMAIKLKEAGLDSFLILEKAQDVGGTWRENTYPGCACDVQSHLYSYSFEGNPEWSTHYAGWQEIHQYIRHCADKYQIRPSIRFGSEVNEAVFDEEGGRWSIATKDGARFSAKAFITGTGPLHKPSFPDIKGLASFKGKVFHSAQWDHDYALKGKKVASIGTGGSAIQYVPEIAPDVEQLHVFQRTPAWVLPRNERKYSAMEKGLFRRVPWIRKLHRAMIYWTNEMRVFGLYLPLLSTLMEVFAKRHIKKGLNDPEMVKRMTPDYRIGCKRVLISNKYFPTFNRPNVELVTDGIAEIREHSIVTQDGKERPVDAIVLGTGFVADPRKYMQGFKLTGLHGQSLLKRWEHGAESYLGISVPGFPNLFQMTGPNTGLGHNSIVFMIECQVNYIVDCLKQLNKNNARYMDLDEEVSVSFNEKITKALQGSVWSSGCTSWYTQSDGKNFTIWPGTTLNYRAQTRHVDLKHYRWASVADDNAVEAVEVTAVSH